MLMSAKNDISSIFKYSNSKAGIMMSSFLTMKLSTKLYLVTQIILIP